MAEKPVASEVPQPSKKRAARPRGLLVELDLLVRDRRVMFRDILSKRLKPPADPPFSRLFLQHGLAGAPAQAAGRLALACGGRDDAVASALADLASTLEKAKPIPGLDHAWPPEPWQVVLITWLEEEAARSLADTLGVPADRVQFHCAIPGEAPFPDSTVWMDASRTLGAGSRDMLAVVDNEASFREALSSGLRCVAIPDDLTGFGDFGGASRVLDDIADLPSVCRELFD